AVARQRSNQRAAALRQLFHLRPHGCARSRQTPRRQAAHAIINILIACCREDLLGKWQIVGRWWLVAPQADEIGEARRNGLRIALRAPIGLVTAAQQIVQLQELDYAVPPRPE